MPKRSTPTKSQILQVARTLFSAHGYKNTTIDDILTAAGVTKGAFYHYFKSKQTLCEGIIDAVTDDYQQLIDQLPTDAEPIEILREILNKLAQLNDSGEWVNCRLLLSVSSESHQDQPELQQKIDDFWHWYMGFFRDLLNRCRDAGQIKTDLDVEFQTSLVLSLMAGTLLLGKITPSAPPLTDMTEIILQALRP